MKAASLAVPSKARGFYKSKYFFVFLTVFVILQISLISERAVGWDESVYTGMGKYIFSGGSSGIWEFFRPVTLPFFLGVFWITKLDVVFYGRVLAVLFSALLLYVLYLMDDEKFPVAPLLLAFTPVFFFHSTSILTEILSTLFAVAAVYLATKKTYVVSGILAGLAFLTKFPQGLVAVAVLFYILTNKEDKLKSSLQFIAPFAIIALSLLIFNFFAYGSALYPLAYASQHQNNLLHSDSLGVLFYFLNMLYQNPLLILAVPAMFYLRRKDAVIACLLVFLIYLSFITNKQVRFSILFLPYAALLASSFFNKIMSQKSSSKYFFALVCIAAIIPSVISIYYQYESEDQKVFEYFSGKNATVLTTTPQFAYSSDSLFIPYYYSPSEGLAEYTANIGKADFVVYHDSFFPCEPYGEECEQSKAALRDVVRKNNKIDEIDGYEFYEVVEGSFG